MAFLTKRLGYCLLLLFITVHSFLMNGYTIQNRYLTVATYFSSIRGSIDPSLFKNSIYVQAVNRTNLRIGLFYDMAPILQRYIDLETYGLIQAFLSLFFILAGIVALTKTLCNSTTAGYLAALLYTATLNLWTLGSPAPYLNFFHHGLPFSYPLMVWSLVFFLKNRYPAAFFLAGISWSFHSMCTVFLLACYGMHWVFSFNRLRLKTIGVSCGAFLLPAFPYVIKSFSHLGTESGSGPLWLEGVRWVADYTCLPSAWPLWLLARSACFMLLFILCSRLIQNRSSRRTVNIFFFTVLLLCLAGTIFADYYPVPLVIKMSMWRSTTIYLFLALPCLGMACRKMLDRSLPERFLSLFLLVFITGYLPQLRLMFFPFLLILLLYSQYRERLPAHRRLTNRGHGALTFLCILFPCIYLLLVNRHTAPVFLFFAAMLLFLLATSALYRRCKPTSVRTYGIVTGILFLVLFDLSVLWHRGGPDIYYRGKRWGKDDPWADVQRAARRVSAKDDVFIIPPHLTGFTNYSLRAILGNWAEGSTLLYLDNQFTADWFERMRAIGWKEKPLVDRAFQNLTTGDIVNVSQKYRAYFIVTEKPKTFHLKKLYENNKYILYTTRPYDTLSNLREDCVSETSTEPPSVEASSAHST